MSNYNHYSVVETESGFLISLESDREVKHSALNWLTEIENDCKDMVRDAESVIHRAVNLANRSLGGDRMDPSLVGRGTPVSHRSRDACSNGTPRIDAKVPLRNPTHSRAGTPRVQPEHFHDIKKTTLLSMDGTRPWLSPKSEPRQIFDGHRNPPGSVKRPSNPNQTLQSQSSTGVSRQGLAKTSSRTKPSTNPVVSHIKLGPVKVDPLDHRSFVSMQNREGLSTGARTLQKRIRAFHRKYTLALSIAESSSADDRAVIKADMSGLVHEIESLASDESDEEALDDVTAKYGEIIRRFTAAGDKSRPQSVKTPSQDKSCKIKSMDCPKFDNTVRGYFRFKRKFELLIQPNMTPDMALLRLKEESVDGKSTAFHLISGKRTLEEAWIALDTIFASPRIVREVILLEAQNLNGIEDPDDHNGLREISTFVTSALDDLESVGLRTVIGESCFGTLMGKIPDEVRTKIDRETLKNNLDTEAQVKMFIEQCDLAAGVAHYNSLRLGVNSSSGKGRRSKGSGAPGTLLSNVGQPDSNPKQICAFHPDAKFGHATLRCRKLLAMSAADAKQTLDKAGACLLCMKAHKKGACESKHTCPEPGCPDPQGHHRLVHSACLIPNQTIPLVQSASQDVGTVNAASLVKQPQSANQEDQWNTQLGLNTIRPCHTAYVMGKRGQLVPVNIFYDCGADLCQVTRTTVARTSIKPVNTLPKLLMGVAGRDSAEDWGSADLVILPLYDESRKRVAELKCIAVNRIGNMKQGDVQKVADSFQEEGYDLSDLRHPCEGEIDVLVGCNYANLLPTPIHTIRSVILGKTRFGKVIYGSHPSFPPQSYERRFPIIYFQTAANLADGTVPVSHVDSRTPRKDSELDIFDRLAATENDCAKCERTRVKREEQKRDALYRECLKYDAENQVFITKMPWIKNYKELSDNSFFARKRLISLTKSFRNDDAMRNWYVKEFEKVIENGVLVPVTPEEDRSWHDKGGNSWYMAHFPVLNESSASTPLRVVFDPNCRGVEIDQYWEAPPNLIPNLPGLILRFRERPVPVSLDISKAYWSVLLEEPESHLHRVLWNGLDVNKPVKMYRMTKNSWGLKPAGSLCSLAMHLISEMHKEQYPTVHDFIHHQMYVDDGCYSVETLEEALQLAKDTSFVLAKGGFILKHFTIGTTAVDLSKFGLDLPPEVKVGGECEAILGQVWHAQEDTIGFKCRVNLSKKIRGARSGPDLMEDKFDEKFPSFLTMRMYVSQILSHFDPVGLTSPVSIRMKCEMGLLTQTVKGWDDPIPDQEVVGNGTNFARCKEVIRLFYGLRRVVFPRCLRPLVVSASESPILVVFADASQLAHGAVAFYLWECGKSNEARIVTAKAKPNPKKPPLLTIPRAECMGALIAVRLAAAICENTTYTVKRRMFILDSTIVLSQIDSPPHRFKTWLASRMDEIHELASKEEFYHIESALNVADDLSRGLAPEAIGPDSRWQKGEEFMRKPLEKWPIKTIKEATQKIEAHDQTELRRNDPRMEVRTGRPPQSLLMSTDRTKTLAPRERDLIDYLFTLEIPEIKNGESFQRAKCRVARILHFLENCAILLKSRCAKFHMTLRRSPKRKALPENFSHLTRREQARVIYELDRFCPSHRQLEMAAYYWIFKAQAEITDPTLASISGRAINPIRDPDGVWRAYGRTAEVKRPLIIIPKGQLAVAILRQFHLPNHSGSQATLALAREEFWIIKCQILANALVNGCVRCRKLRKRVVEVTMAPLREELTNRSQVFSVVIIDLCGPYYTLADRRNTRQVPAQAGKVWVLVIVCAASRAVHLELVEGYNTENFLAAYDSFTSLRGHPTGVIADRGSQITGANNTLTALWQNVDQARLQKQTCAQTTWEFVPTAAHSFIGQAERAVQSFKRTMEAIYHTRSPQLPKLAFSRILTACANIMNSRPLGIRRCKASKLDDDRLVRPNDLLLGRATSNITPMVSFQDLSSPFCDRKTYDKLIRQKEAFLNEFWTKFQRVSFESLFPREKWQKSGRPVERGDIVLMRDPNPIRGHWTWGEVDETHPSAQDGAIRKVTVRYKPLSETQDSSPSSSKLVVRAVRDLCVLLYANERDTGPTDPSFLPRGSVVTSQPPSANQSAVSPNDQ